MMASKTSVKLVADGGIQVPGGKRFATKSRNFSMLTPLSSNLSQTFSWKTANFLLMACRLSNAKAAALLGSSWQESAAGKSKEQLISYGANSINAIVMRVCVVTTAEKLGHILSGSCVVVAHTLMADFGQQL